MLHAGVRFFTCVKNLPSLLPQNDGDTTGLALMRLSSLAEEFAARPGSSCGLHFEALAALARGEDVILLTIGDPDLDTMSPVVEAAVSALRRGDTHYTEFAGRPELRRAIAELHDARTGIPTQASQVIVGSGAQNAVFSSCLALFSPGDEVLVPQPAYLTYAATVRASGARPISTAATPGSLRFNIDAMRAATTERTRGVLLANPCNPTGAVLRTDEMRELASLAKDLDLWVISDEVYSSLTYDAKHVCIAAASDMAERTVTVGSLSKSHAMTGWRMGWAIAPHEAALAMASLASCMHHGLPGFVQAGALAALAHYDEYAMSMCATFRSRRDVALGVLSQAKGLLCRKPEAGMFVLVDVSGTGMNSAEFARRLYHEVGVAVLDGAAFGDCVAGHVRLSLGTAEASLIAGCERLTAFVNGLNVAVAA
ncbi:pyridoxal phosphate-dependent aminotransferase [Belnapia moabensis]|uniref:pyridoxal phosphate-dependent aminotransferase n=1 Tax=Belnapia moabensis TaxID=365533 RepID=UPI001B807DB2|nr:aminotransferase class I/II-fold pyridoxal phosphate-dependent enzyme [Belnapia moabensis]